MLTAVRPPLATMQQNYVLPVFGLTSCFPVISQAKSTLIGRILKVTHWGAAPGTKSDAYDCLVCWWDVSQCVCYLWTPKIPRCL